MAFCREKNQKLLFKVDSKLKFRMWFKYGLKAQKLLAQGIALGIMAISNAPCKGNSFILPGVLKLLPLQGDRLPPQTTQGVALGYELLPLQGV